MTTRSRSTPGSPRLSAESGGWKVASVALLAGTGLLLGSAAPAVRAADARQEYSVASAPSRALLDQYCVGCHNQRTRTAALALDTMDLGSVAADAASWEKVAQKLRAGAMPPPGRPRPDRVATGEFVSRLEASLDRAAAARPDSGRTEAMHRLNRAEYRNAVHDLLGLDFDPSSLLPADVAGGNGFDNMAVGLSVTPALMERYFSAARRISRLAVGSPLIEPTTDVFRATSAQQDDRIGDDLPFGSRGGMAIRYSFPVDGDYSLSVRLQASQFDYIRGLDEPHQMDIRLDGRRLRSFTIGGAAPASPPPISYSGRVISWNPDWQAYAKKGAGDGLEVRLAVEAGVHVVSASFAREQWEPDGVLQPPVAGHARSVSDLPDDKPAVLSLLIKGPLASTGPGMSPSRRQIFTCRPTAASEEPACARTIIAALARRAFRRPVSSTDLDSLLDFYEAGRREADFDAGIQRALEAMLTDPEFLFRVERDPDGIGPRIPYRISNLELASRLSFFLWNSIPDERLLDAAARGTLADRDGLDREARRMLADARWPAALVNDFAGQWLLLRRMPAVSPDPVVYPDFDDSLRDAFARETELFFESTLLEDRSVVDLLSASYTFINERLARHYGIPGIYGSRFRRVDLPNGRRWGLLGQGSLLTTTSYPNRTSPVVRGKWLLDNILGTPPPPPPPNVPNLPDRGESGEPASVRERLERHRRNPACAACHAPMDPLGFALENFDGIGAWRAREGGGIIDASGALPTGATFEGPAELRGLLLAEREQFVRTLTEKLLMYALGRELEYDDRPVIRQIVRDAAATNYRWSSIMLGIVHSTPFLMRRSAS